ncbi:uncharacterized protein PgNI_02140 [Pyricularia grisea]|uniref:Major facilitator superfamily (MFS) profile domain-containing protein n=1 Tax=Pyricularia grisea TaxID=148305 RepID=A0A6P8BFD2_PYRGI|nr:uncharacterized protein PgNI_02140 [Pyricularia grisea]TLD15420.1 hypothetical protein PgNI_02140 [Pyricularia grisea]
MSVIEPHQFKESGLHAGLQNESSSPQSPPPPTDPADGEAKLRQKIDLAIVPLATLMFLFCFIDRANIGNARLASFESDLGLKGNDFNSVNSIFFIPYILLEVQINILCKRVGPGWFLPTITILFGLITIASSWVNSYAQLAVCRFLLGLAEAGLMPGLSYYLSRWYRRSELIFRLSMYISAAPLSGAVGGLLASGILRIPGFGSFPAGSWRTIFAVEGMITVLIGIAAMIFLADRPETARFLNAEEKSLAISRVRCERIGGDEVLDSLNLKKLWKGVANPVVLATAVTFLLETITVQGLTFFAPTIVRTIFPQASVIQQQLLTVPPYILGFICILAVCYASWKRQTRQIFIIVSAPPIMIGYVIFLATVEPVPRYVATFLIASSVFTVGPLCHAQAAANVNSDSARSMSIAVTMLFGNVASLISTWSFQSWDGPVYRIGNGLNFATSTTMMLVAIMALIWMRRDNRARDARGTRDELRGLSSEQEQELEWNHRDFRWSP